MAYEKFYFQLLTEQESLYNFLYIIGATVQSSSNEMKFYKLFWNINNKYIYFKKDLILHNYILYIFFEDSTTYHVRNLWISETSLRCPLFKI